MSESAPPRIVPYLKMLAPVISFLVVLSEILIPVFYHASQLAYGAWCLLPLDVMYIAMGLVVCFFGGMVRAHFDRQKVKIQSLSTTCAKISVISILLAFDRTICPYFVHLSRD